VRCLGRAEHSTFNDEGDVLVIQRSTFCQRTQFEELVGRQSAEGSQNAVLAQQSIGKVKVITQRTCGSQANGDQLDELVVTERTESLRNF
jgi:hypothetical protein